ncbi:MAG: ABC transporter permease [Bryobacteraceae bacterium]
MDFPPIALLPCRMMLSLAALMVPPAARAGWMDEWFAEIWYRWKVLQEQNETGYNGLRQLYSICSGCFRDGWWHFSESGEGRPRIIEWMRSPRFCLMSLLLLLAVFTLITGFLPATRNVIEPLPFTNQDRIAVISRFGRLEPVRQGIPQDLAERWWKKSRFIRGLAICSFPKMTSVAGFTGTHQAISIRVTSNFFSTLGVTVPRASEQRVRNGTKGVWVSDLFWRKQLHSDRRVAGARIEINGTELVIEGVLPAGFWFLSPMVSLYEIASDALPPQGMLVVRCKDGVLAHDLENELTAVAERGGLEFARTAPHAMFLRDAVKTPLWLFGAALFVAVVLVVLAHGSRWIRLDEGIHLVSLKSWRSWGFFCVKTALALLLVLIVGTEIFVGQGQQTISEALGGPALIWFYIVGCTLVLFASISDQKSRCRVCQRLLGFPIRIGCPGCLFLEWAGTEFLCPQGHGVLYVPHHVSCWEEEDRWVLLEV